MKWRCRVLEHSHPSLSHDLPLTRPQQAVSDAMALTYSSGKITSQHVTSSYALNGLLQNFSVLPNNPASLYLSNTSTNQIIYILPTRIVTVDRQHSRS
jgi:hypothetical protein